MSSDPIISEPTVTERDITDPSSSDPKTGAKIKTLRQARAFFFRRATPRIIIPALVLVAVLRFRQGGWSWWDLAVLAGIIVLEPFVEWTIHVYVLHFRPIPVGNRRLDIHAARKHREHHRAPNDPHTSFVPLVDLVVLSAIALGIVWAIMRGDYGLILTAVMLSLGILLTYEWTHFLIHTAYQPKTRYYRYIWRAHRLHHFKNEHYWMGVTNHAADHILGTFPQKSEVENSKTARTLGIDVA